MITTPMKPSTVALQRRRRTVSPRKSAAPKVVNRGAVKLRATARDSGSRAKAEKDISMELSPTEVRQK